MIQAEKQNRNRQEPDPVLAAMEEWKMALTGSRTVRMPSLSVFFPMA